MISFAVNKLGTLLTDVTFDDQSYNHNDDDEENGSDDSSYQAVQPRLVFFCNKIKYMFYLLAKSD